MLNKECVLSLPKVSKDIGSVLIKSGENDDAFVYRAPLGQRLPSQAMTVFFHAGSRMLERVKLFGSIKVVVEFHETAKFAGELTLFDRENLTENGNVALKLNVYEEIEPRLPIEQHMVPMT